MVKKMILVGAGLVIVGLALAFLIAQPIKRPSGKAPVTPPPPASSSQNTQPAANNSDDTSAIDAELNAAENDMNAAADSQFDATGLDDIK